jgi:hypothetical protein
MDEENEKEDDELGRGENGRVNATNDTYRRNIHNGLHLGGGSNHMRTASSRSFGVGSLVMSNEDDKPTWQLDHECQQRAMLEDAGYAEKPTISGHLLV